MVSGTFMYILLHRYTKEDVGSRLIGTCRSLMVNGACIWSRKLTLAAQIPPGSEPLLSQSLRLYPAR